MVVCWGPMPVCTSVSDAGFVTAWGDHHHIFPLSGYIGRLSAGWAFSDVGLPVFLNTFLAHSIH